MSDKLQFVDDHFYEANDKLKFVAQSYGSHNHRHRHSTRAEEHAS